MTEGYEINRKTVYSVLVLTALTIGMVSLVSADPPAPPPPSPPDDEPSSSWTGNTSIQSCDTDFDASANQLEYCSQPYIQYKTKTIYFCDADGDNTYDSGETKGDYENPEPSCNTGETYVQLDSETRQFATCGKEDGESDSYDETPQTTSVDENTWSCPGTKALSLRHEAGSLNPGIGLSASGYSDLDSMTYKSKNNMSYYFTAAIPACVNRIPMINLNVQMDDRNGNLQAEKTGLYAAHMNLYYGPNGDQQGRLREVNLPEQKSFRKKYRTEANVKSYRMWAWRQRFAESVTNTVNEKNLQMPENRDVSEIAEDYRDEGRSVGDLWLSTQFLYGAEAGEPQNQTQTITRQINTTCRIDVRKVVEEDFDDSDDFVQYIEDNPEDAKNLLGHDGGNYCNVNDEQELQEIWNATQADTTDRIFEEKDGFVSTTLFDNRTVDKADLQINVTDMNLTHNTTSGGPLNFGEDENETKINTSDRFKDYAQAYPDKAEGFLRNHSEYWIPEDGDLELDDYSALVVEGPVGEETVYVASFRADLTRYMTPEEYSGLDADEQFDQLEGPVLDDEWSPNDNLTPVDRFEGRYVWNVLDAQAGDGYEAELRLNTSIDQSDYYTDVEVGLIQEQEARESWNWRALQEITMTELAQCMYNWESCMNNKRSMSERSYEATEVFDSGYGPWEDSFTFQWSQQAAEDRADELQTAIDQSYEYNRSLDTTFDKYYDGARGYDQQDITPTNVYRRCDPEGGWTSQAGEFYDDSQFICPDSESTAADGSEPSGAEKNKAYTCKFRPGSNLPSYVKQAEEFEARQVDGDWYVCREMSPPKWHKDDSPPEVFVTGAPDDWTTNTEVAEVSCQDDVATCDTDSYRMKTYDVGDQPDQCPTDYSEYDIRSGEMEVGKHEYVCGAAKDEVGKVSYSPQPTEFKVRNLNSRLIYPNDRVVTSLDRDVFVFYEITNNLEEERSVEVSVSGVNSSFVESGQKSQRILLRPESSERLQIKVTPETAGNQELLVRAEDLQVGYTIENRMPIEVRSTAETGDREVPGLQVVQLMVLMSMAGTVYLFW